MDFPERIQRQRHKERRGLSLFLLCALLGSLATHAIAMTIQVGNFWHPTAKLEQEEETEIVAEDAPNEESVVENTMAESAEPPTETDTIQTVAVAPESALPPLPLPLSPHSQAPLPLGQDAPSQKTSDPKPDLVTPLMTKTGAIPMQSGGSGPMSSPNGQGQGFGRNQMPTGFNANGHPNGKLDGQPTGKADGQSGGQVGGQPTGKPGETAARTTSPEKPSFSRDRAQKPVCLNCPKPRYRGSEGSPRVTYDIAPDGRVMNVRLRQSSGNPDLDRETLETLAKWRFDPKTIPDSGQQNVRVRVTFEEDGSLYQRQNERRRQTVERPQVAGQEQRRQETGVPQASPAIPPTSTKPTSNTSGGASDTVQPVSKTSPVPLQTETTAPLSPTPTPLSEPVQAPQPPAEAAPPLPSEPATKPSPVASPSLP